jgi:hypothetical protein
MRRVFLDFSTRASSSSSTNSRSFDRSFYLQQRRRVRAMKEYSFTAEILTRNAVFCWETRRRTVHTSGRCSLGGGNGTDCRAASRLREQDSGTDTAICSRARSREVEGVGHRASVSLDAGTRGAKDLARVACGGITVFPVVQAAFAPINSSIVETRAPVFAFSTTRQIPCFLASRPTADQ